MQYNALLLVLNQPSRTGRVYSANSIARAFQDLQSRVDAGLVYGEYGSPHHRYGRAPSEQVLLVEMHRVCLKVVSVSIDKTGIWGMIEPCGPHGDAMAEMIDADWLGQPTLAARALNRLDPNDPTRVLEVIRFGAFDFVDDSQPIEEEVE